MAVALPQAGQVEGSDIFVSWYVPSMTAAANFKAGRKRQVVDIFGEWRSAEGLSMIEARDLKLVLPNPLIPASSVLEANFELEKGKIPYGVLDRLRENHHIDVTGLSISLTEGGNLYRAYALMR